MAPTTGFPVSDMNNIQKGCLERIWRSNRRELIDVRPSQEKDKVEGHTYRFEVRLYHFFFAACSPQTTSEYLKPASQSCLYEILQRFLVEIHNPSSQVQLSHGRTVIGLQHEYFLTELNTFELQGRPCSQEFIQKHSFGAFLYHVPSEALSAVACALRLVLVTLYARDHKVCPTIDQ